MSDSLRVTLKGSAAKPIDLYNVHSPTSKKHGLKPTVRTDIIQWFADHTENRSLIGGDMSSNLISLDVVLSPHGDFAYCYEANHKHDDLVISKGIHAESIACERQKTSDTHRKCIVIVPLDPTLN